LSERERERTGWVVARLRTLTATYIIGGDADSKVKICPTVSVQFSACLQKPSTSV